MITRLLFPRLSPVLFNSCQHSVTLDRAGNVFRHRPRIAIGGMVPLVPIWLVTTVRVISAITNGVRRREPRHDCMGRFIQAQTNLTPRQAFADAVFAYPPIHLRQTLSTRSNQSEREGSHAAKAAWNVNLERVLPPTDLGITGYLQFKTNQLIQRTRQAGYRQQRQMEYLLNHQQTLDCRVRIDQISAALSILFVRIPMCEGILCRPKNETFTIDCRRPRFEFHTVFSHS